MSHRVQPTCWSCAQPVAPRRAGQCDSCAELADVAELPLASADTCLRCGRDAAGSLCGSCGDAPDMWALLEASSC